MIRVIDKQLLSGYLLHSGDCDLYSVLLFSLSHDGTDSPPDANDVVVILNNFKSKIIKVKVSLLCFGSRLFIVGKQPHSVIVMEDTDSSASCGKASGTTVSHCLKILTPVWLFQGEHIHISLLKECFNIPFYSYCCESYVA